jgi:hypothetical protein
MLRAGTENVIGIVGLELQSIWFVSIEQMNVIA